MKTKEAIGNNRALYLTHTRSVEAPLLSCIIVLFVGEGRGR